MVILLWIVSWRTLERVRSSLKPSIVNSRNISRLPYRFTINSNEIISIVIAIQMKCDYFLNASTGMSEKQLIFNVETGVSQNNLLTYSVWYVKFPHSIEFEKLCTFSFINILEQGKKVDKSIHKLQVIFIWISK